MIVELPLKRRCSCHMSNNIQQNMETRPPANQNIWANLVESRRTRLRAQEQQQRIYFNSHYFGDEGFHMCRPNICLHCCCAPLSQASAVRLYLRIPCIWWSSKSFPSCCRPTEGWQCFSLTVNVVPGISGTITWCHFISTLQYDSIPLVKDVVLWSKPI